MNNLISLNTSAPNFNLVADTYGFIDTGKIVERFARKGWEISSAKEVKVRTIERQGFQKHLIRFRNESFPRIEGLSNDHSSIPELIIENSHDGTGALKLYFGIFRMACLNGIITGSSLASFRVIHSQNAIKNLDHAIDGMTSNIPSLVERVGRFASIEFDRDLSLSLARKGCEIRLGHLKGIQDMDLASALEPKRFADLGKDAFSVFNVLQERVIRGGIRYKQINEKNGFVERKFTRAVNSISQSVKYNRELWNALEEVTA
jgi:hypothetical protein